MALTLHRFNFFLRFILIFCTIILLYFCIDLGNYEIGVCIAGIILLFLPDILKIFKIYLSDSVVFIFLTFLFLGVLEGTVLEPLFWYDKILHLISGILYFTLGMIYLVHKYRKSKVKYHYTNAVIFSYLFALFILISWEVFEATCDLLFGFNLLHDGLIGCLWDLLFDFIGATLGAMLFFWHFRKKEIKLLSFLTKDVFKTHYEK